MKLTRISLLCFASTILLGASACQDREASSQKGIPRSAQNESSRARVQHILIAFKGSVPGERVTRSKKEAEELARKILEEARAKPTDFDRLVKAHTDDQVPGVYELANFGVQARGAEFPRAQMVTGFGNVAFALKPGEVGLVEFDPQQSPYGYHILLRLPD